jgi:phosphoglycolate phosphatase-like HAD superfamily hydrolase
MTSSPKPNVLVDIDGVLADCNGPLYARLNSLGYQLKNEECDHYGATAKQLQERYNMSPERAVEVLAKIWWGKGFMIGQPVRLDAIAGMRRIAGLCKEVHIVTARNAGSGPHVRSETEAWIERYGFAHTGLHFETDKVAHAKRHKLDYVIEDAPHTAEEAWRHGLRVFLVDATYNRHVKEKDGLWRVTHLTQIAPRLQTDWRTRCTG